MMGLESAAIVLFVIDSCGRFFHLAFDYSPLTRRYTFNPKRLLLYPWVIVQFAAVAVRLCDAWLSRFLCCVCF